MCMPSLERRFQILLDQRRYDLLVRESHRSNRSVGAVIRDAIDVCFPADADRHGTSLGELLDMTATPDGEGADWRTMKAEAEDALDDELSR